jgi:hypothetical protein
MFLIYVLVMENNQQIIEKHVFDDIIELVNLLITNIKLTTTNLKPLLKKKFYNFHEVIC